ncbi:hypothetical protein BD626DRAFT_637880 [Schizophyllum amplum]|uniref:Uncharacterized protein n=1 Tax=Schizophyllum amplum TaxID=97359 RepID=A0A550BS30_9AGAR|nr:hypothetical protein BD626DRAFT_637880 [Auriculariopsis ampla]
MSDASSNFFPPATPQGFARPTLHCESMLPSMQTNNRVQQLSLKYDYYGLWNPTATFLVETGLERPGVVFPQPKLFLYPESVLAQVKKTTSRLAEPDTESEASRSPRVYRPRTNPISGPTPQVPAPAVDRASGDGDDELLEKLDWIDAAIEKSAWIPEDSRRGDVVCNLKEAFPRQEIQAEITIFMLWEGKPLPSSKLTPDKYRSAFYKEVYKGIHALIIQATYLLTSSLYRHQDKVFGVVMVGDFWTWNVISRVEGCEHEENLQDYNDDNVPIKLDYHWSPMALWGSVYSNAESKRMMKLVNQEFPPYTSVATPSTPSTDEASQFSSASTPAIPVETASGI